MNPTTSRKIQHGHSPHRTKSAEYRSWTSMNTRCSNPNVGSWKNYGGRGIQVCDRWRDFSMFLSDMGLRSEGTSLDRINNDGNYEPGNCRWATTPEQRMNTSRSRILRHGGKAMALTMWSRITGLSARLISSRLDRGWSIDSALTTPKHSVSLTKIGSTQSVGHRRVELLISAHRALLSAQLRGVLSADELVVVAALDEFSAEAL